jgi:localization factor PodJL
MSPVDALNRTIEALEARLDELAAARRSGQGAPQQPVAAQQAQQPHPTMPSKPDVVNEILERRKRLDAARQRAADMRLAAAAPKPEPIAVRAPEPAPKPTAAPAAPLPEPAVAAVAAPAAAQSDSDLREVAQAIVALRRELGADLRRDLAQDFSREVAALRAELKKTDAGEGEMEAMRADLAALRQMVNGAAREDTVRSMDARWSDICGLIAEVDPGSVRDELATLTARLDEVRAQLTTLPQRQDETVQVAAKLDRIETLLHDLAEARLDGSAGDETLGRIETHLDALSLSIKGLGAQVERNDTSEVLTRLESKVQGFADHLGRSETALVSALAPQLQRLSQRIEELGAGNENAELIESLDTLSARIGDGLPQEALSEIATYIEALSAKIDGLAPALADMARSKDETGHAVFSRFETLVERAEQAKLAERPWPELNGLQQQLDVIATRLDTTVAPVSAPSDDALKGLEAQISELTRLLESSATSAVRGSDETLSVLEPRLLAIEEHLSHSQDDIIAAASRAAEAAVSAFLQSGADDFAGPSEELATISALAEDLQALERLTRQSDERTARTFDALHDTLLKIADHLEHLDRARPAAPAFEPVSATMPTPVTETATADDSAAFAAPLFGGAMAHAQETNGYKDYAAAEPAQELAYAEAAEDARDERPRSLLGRLTDRVKPKRKTAPATPRAEPAMAPAALRTHVQPTPPIDPSPTLDEGAANQPLEPGSGSPDIGRILQKVREQQNAGMYPGTTTSPSYSETEKADFIAAARRAAQAAAAEIESTHRLGPGKPSGAPAGGVSGSGRRRPVLIAVGAILLAIMSYPLVTDFLNGEQPEQTTVAEAPTLPNDVADEPVETAVADPVEQVEAASAIAETPADAQSTASVEPERIEPTSDAPAPIAEPDLETVALAEDAPTPPVTEPVLEPAPIAEDEPSQAVRLADEPVLDDETAQQALIASVDALPADIGTIALLDAAKAGDPLALFEIGARFMEGRGTEVDMGEAAVWYRAAADRDFAPAQYRLANFLEKGTGVERNVEEAQALYEAAAEQGNASAMHNLAVIHATGAVGGEPDYAAAAEWFEQAAEHGVRDSQFNLAVLYARGSGVEQDLKASYKWFAIAANGGDTDAAGKRDEVAAAMDDADLDAARAEVELFEPQALEPGANTVDIPEAWATSDTRTATIDMTQAVRNIQIILNNNGFDAGAPDGILGERTVAAIKAFQAEEKMETTGRIDDALVRALLARNNQVAAAAEPAA